MEKFVRRSNDIDKATAAKFKVEQKQREEAKVRKDENAMFANKVSVLTERMTFHPMKKWQKFSIEKLIIIFLTQSFLLSFSIAVLQKRRRRQLDLLESALQQTYNGTEQQQLVRLIKSCWYEMWTFSLRNWPRVRWPSCCDLFYEKRTRESWKERKKT